MFPEPEDLLHADVTGQNTTSAIISKLSGQEQKEFTESIHTDKKAYMYKWIRDIEI